MSMYVISPVNDQQEKVVKAFLEALDISFIKAEEHLPYHVLKGIADGQEDFKARRTITLE